MSSAARREFSWTPPFFGAWAAAIAMAPDIALKAAIATDVAQTEAVANAFQIGVPTARVVKLKNTNHYVFMSNEADVLRELRAFLAGLH